MRGRRHHPIGTAKRRFDHLQQRRSRDFQHRQINRIDPAIARPAHRRQRLIRPAVKPAKAVVVSLVVSRRLCRAGFPWRKQTTEMGVEKRVARPLMRQVNLEHFTALQREHQVGETRTMHADQQTRLGHPRAIDPKDPAAQKQRL